MFDFDRRVRAAYIVGASRYNVGKSDSRSDSLHVSSHVSHHVHAIYGCLVSLIQNQLRTFW